MSESTTTSIKISESEHQKKIDELMEIREKPIFEKIQWILGTTSIRNTQDHWFKIVGGLEKEATSERKQSIWFAVIGLLLAIGYNITINDLTNPVALLFIVVTLFPALVVQPAIRAKRKVIAKMKKDGIYSVLAYKTQPSESQLNTHQYYTFETFSDCINNGRPIRAEDNTIDFNDVLFIEKIDKQISENLLLN